MALATALLLTRLSTASPIVLFPINSQVPPAARIGEPFSFVFSPSTVSSSSPITYSSILDSPRWLSIDSSSRRLFGTPSKDDVAPGSVVGVPLNLVATDDFGSTTLPAALVVSRSPGPKVKIPFKNQHPDVGTFSRPSSFLSAPGQAFSFQLDPNTFSKPHEYPISYYATMADNTPLPAWMTFDPSRLSFSGRTPPAESLIQPPRRFSFQLIAGARNIRRSNFTVSPGDPFSFSLGPYLSNPRVTEVAVDAGPSHPWIQFNSSTATLFGIAPKGLRDTAVITKIIAKSKTSNESASLSFGITIRAPSGGKWSTPADSTTGAALTVSPSGQLSGVGDGGGNNRFNPMVFAVLLPPLLLLSLGVCALFWYFRRRKDNRKRPAISTRDISGPIPGTVVARTPGLGVSQSLPELTEYVGKSFSADDVFGPDKQTYLESRGASQTRPELPRHSTPTGNCLRASEPPWTLEPRGRTPGGTRSKIRASLSSVTENSIADLVDSRGIESVGNDRRSFRDKIEIYVPSLRDASGPAHPGSPSRKDVMPSPQPDYSQTLLEADAAPARSESRHSYHPPAASTRKLSWSWLKGAKGGGRESKLSLGMKRLSEQPSLLTLISRSPSAAFEQPSDPTALGRPPTRSGLILGGTVGNPGQEELPKVSDTTADAAPPGSMLHTSTGDSTLGFPIRGEAAGLSPDVYDGIIEHNPFRPSRTWSTVPTTDDWADETVESLALSRATSQRQQNWTVIQESPVVKPREAAASGMVQVALSLYQLTLMDGADGEGKGEGEAEGDATRGVEGGAARGMEAGEVSLAVLSPAPSRPWAAPRADRGGDGKREISGLNRKRQSKGASLRSDGSRLDFAAFI
ncbi:hypothetical protein C8A05DRAFT_44468 [Staphylotrichum tortipilum]|uniref:Uncharacterized protein n=1 Tax=Staphylotrichum tortipilum TaxID=2831512 RepID=A0AAN6RT48_9PEZI|nr:hypothetical protein C8A05DRAFT_44468 [Staphylotrichum longicolle]